MRWRDNTPVTSRFEKEVLDFRCFSPFFSAKDELPWWSKMQRKWEKRAACNFWTLRLIVPNSLITYNLSNFITGCRSLGDKIIEVLLYLPMQYLPTYTSSYLNDVCEGWNRRIYKTGSQGGNLFAIHPMDGALVGARLVCSSGNLSFENQMTISQERW